ncbi:MCE family protein [Pelagicoccus mobilis]|uniref:MCE family protein n=1 Tax=Pelagicoccus mobilis TaxID=415221 RepID=A0A934RZY0_9BACT|nr:MCE family protein [Pelagicoccus mobilis]
MLALLVGAYMIFKELRNEGPRVTVAFQDGAGLEAGKTKVQHKGLTVGTVDSVALSKDLSEVEAVITLNRSAKGLARDGSDFWILRPQIGLEGVTGLGTILSGPSIQVAPGIGPFKKRFTGLDRAPLQGSQLGYHYTLRVDQLGSLNPGAPVLYKQFKVGEVVETKLAPDATAILITILINSPYDKLVRTNSVFWNASGIDMKVGLLGAKIQTDSLQSVLTGGIMFATPEDLEDGELAPENTEFPLQKEADSDWHEWKPIIQLEQEGNAPSLP